MPRPTPVTYSVSGAALGGAPPSIESRKLFKGREVHLQILP